MHRNPKSIVISVSVCSEKNFDMNGPILYHLRRMLTSDRFLFFKISDNTFVFMSLNLLRRNSLESRATPVCALHYVFSLTTDTGSNCIDKPVQK